MSKSGTLLVRVFLSRAQLPIPDATVAVYTVLPDSRRKLLAVRITDESGVAGPITLPTGDSMGLTPDAPVPFTDYQLIVEHPDYQIAVFEDLQLFPGVETVQDVPLIPLSAAESPDSNTTTVTPQPL